MKIRLIIGMTVFLGFQWDKMRFSNSQANLLPDDHPVNLEYQSFLKQFGEEGNAIVFAKDGFTVGIGAGQMSRVYSSRVAAMKAADAGLTIKSSVMASDAFFPFRDGLDIAIEHGVTAVIQPGGSKRDDEVIAAANEHDIAMVLTGMRHYRH